MKNIEIYTLNYCPYCKKALLTLTRQGVEFKNIDVTGEEETYSEKLKKEYKIDGDVTFPQIIIDGARFGGNDKLQEIIKQGEFDRIFR